METNPPPVTTGESLRDRIMNKILRINDDDEHHDQDICRVCRLSGDDTLYHPCLCTGSIKYVHQDCLMQWLKYSKKEVCELCNHKFSFRPLYREDMPERLPVKEFMKGVLVISARFMRHFLVCCLVATCWLGFVPLMATRIHRLVLSGLMSFFSPKLLSLFSLENVAADIGTGTVIVAIFTCTLFSLIWLKDQIMVGAPPAFIHLPPGRAGNGAVHVELRDEVNVHPEVRPDVAENPPADDRPIDNQADGDGVVQPADVVAAAEQPLAEDVDVADGPVQPPADEVQPVPQPEVAAVVPAAVPPVDNNIFGEENEDADHLADDFTWQRILGLDGSTAFIDAVFYVIAMNLVFDVMFLHWPSQIGKILFHLLGYSDKVVYFSVPIRIFTGYVVVFVANYFVHQLAGYFRYGQIYTLSAMFHLMVKVFLLFIVEILFFPVICGWWLDICSLPLTGISLDARLATFRSYPLSSTFLHWMVGMIYVFYSASFILVLRELLRPGVLWFIRNLNDPEFNPILEMIQQSVVRHARRLVASTMLFFTIILLVVYMPLRLIRFVSPSTLPYVLTASAETSMGEVSVELVLLQLVLPTVLEYSKAFSVLKRVVQLWCRVVGGWLKLDSYLLPRRPPAANADEGPDAARRQENIRRLMAEAGQLLRPVNLLQLRQADGEVVINAAADPPAAGADEGQPAVDPPKDNNVVGVVAAVEDEGIGGEEEDDDVGRVHEDLQSTSHADNALPSISHNTVEAGKETKKTNANDDDQEPSTSAGPLDFAQPTTSEVKPSSRSASPVQRRVDDDDPPANDEPRVVDRARQPNVDDDPDEDLVRLAQMIAQRELQENHLGARHQALLMIRDNIDYEEYERPDMFAARIVALMMCLALTAIALSFLFFLIPVSIGRFMFAMVAKFDAAASTKGVETTPTHELYTLAAGLYFCWVVSKVWMIVYEWCQKGWNYVSKVFRSTSWLVVRLMVAMVPMFIVIPFMFGLLFQLLVVAPLRVTMSQTPLFFPWKEWAIGVLHFKIFCASILMGPDWWLKTAFERVYAGGIRGFELRYLLTNLALPLFNVISLQISLPYVLAKVVLVFFDLPDETKVAYTRFAYPFTLLCVTAIAFFLWQWQKLKSLAQKIRNDKYLIGTQLVNFYRDSGASAALDATANTSTATAGGGVAP